MLYIFLLELLVLFLLSRVVTVQLSMFFYRILRNERVSSYLLALIFLPGTIIHELSHAIAAYALFVPVGRIDLMPKIYNDSLKLGSVEVGKSDVFRDFFIGIAPFFAGSAILVSILFYSFSNIEFGLNNVSFAIIYAIFVISNTMYSSKKDMEGAIEFFGVILIPIAIFYFSGVRPDLSYLTKLLDIKFLEHAVYLMLAPIVINLGLIAFAKILNRN